MWSSNPYFDLYGGFGRSYNDMQILADGTFLAASSGYLEWGEGTSVAKISIKDGSLQSWQPIDEDISYSQNSLFSAKGKVYFRTAVDSYLMRNSGIPLNRFSPSIQKRKGIIKSNINYSLITDETSLVLKGTADLSGIGSSNANKIYGNSGNNLIRSAAGDDWLYGKLGNDVFNGGKGRDTAQFSSRNNTIKLTTTKKQNTGDGKDRLISIENVNGGGGKDKIIGNKAKNILNGQKGKDRLYGGKNDDILIGGGGKDKCWGQQGNDTFRIKRGAGYMIVKDFSDGKDRIQLGSGHKGLKLKTRGDDVYVYQRKDLMAVVEDAAGDLTRKGKYLV